VIPEKVLSRRVELTDGKLLTGWMFHDHFDRRENHGDADISRRKTRGLGGNLGKSA
jgi:hypothetical protein